MSVQHELLSFAAVKKKQRVLILREAELSAHTIGFCLLRLMFCLQNINDVLANSHCMLRNEKKDTQKGRGRKERNLSTGYFIWDARRRRDQNIDRQGVLFCTYETLRKFSLFLVHCVGYY